MAQAAAQVWDEDGVRKAAALLLAMSKDTATRILKQLDPDDVGRILRAAAELGAIEMGDVHAIIDAFEDGFQAEPKLVGTIEDAEALANASLPPERAAAFMADLVGVRRDVLKDLAALPETRVVELLMAEHPQAGACVLARMKPDAVARILVAAPAPMRGEWLARMLNARPVEDDVFAIVEAALLKALETTDAPVVDDKGPSRIANIVNRLDPEEIEPTLGELESLRPEQAQAVRALIFRFDDLVLLSQQERAIVFDQISADRVVLALAGADEPIKDAVLSALGQRARRMVEAELASDAPAPKRDVTNARRSISETVLKLAEAGSIELPSMQPAEAPA